MDNVEQKYVKRLDEILAMDGDAEPKHNDADNLIIEMLKEIGFNEFAEKFDNMTKWYA